MERYKKYVLYLLPLCLNGNIILNIILRILGIGKDSVFRLLFVYGFLFIISISFILFIEYKKVVKEGLIGFCIWIVLLLFELSLVYNGDVVLFIRYRYSNLFLGFLFWSGFLLLSTNWKQLKRIMNVYFVLIQVFAVIYLAYVQMYLPEYNYFFNIDYLTVATMFFNLLIILFIILIKKDDNVTYRNKLLYFSFLFFVTAAIIRTESKRDGIGILGIVFFLIIVGLFYRTKKYTIYILVCVTSIICSSFLIRNSEKSRYQNFLGESSSLKNLGRNNNYDSIGESISPNGSMEVGNIDFFEEAFGGAKNVSGILNWAQRVYIESNQVAERHPQYKLDDKMTALVRYVEYDKLLEEDFKDEKLSFEEYSTIKKDVLLINHTSIGARLYLYANAVNEFKKSPLFGQGAYHFQAKYGSYTHCVFLEILSDFGAIGLLINLLCLLFYFISLFSIAKIGIRDVSDILILYTLFSLPTDLFGGDLYSYLSVAKYALCPILCILKVNKQNSSIVLSALSKNHRDP